MCQVGYMTAVNFTWRQKLNTEKMIGTFNNKLVEYLIGVEFFGVLYRKIQNINI